ncbi:MAG: radical SAM family heme chaperone HemW [Acidimicrobiia bacterium]
MTPERADGFAATASAYVHIPFCAAVCPYCDFAVVAGRDDMTQRYVDAVVSEIERSEPWRPLDSVYFGGGTPSHVDPVFLARILEALADRHGIAENADLSLEANPEDFTENRAALLSQIGLNRVSFGAQSLDGGVLVMLGRRHRADEVESSVIAARNAGFENVSVDLIYGSPEESTESWVTTLGAVVALDVDHVSCYALTVEPGTPLARAVKAGTAPPDPDIQADRYESAAEILSEAGFSRYEVSNWSKPGFEASYNLAVWAQGEYEAYGNGAHGFRDGVRFRNARRLDTYLELVDRGDLGRVGSEHMSGFDLEVDRVFVGLRRTVGVSHGAGTQALLESEDGKRLEDAGVISSDHDRLRVIKPLFTDAVHRSVLDLQRPIVSIESNA